MIPGKLLADGLTGRQAEHGLDEAVCQGDIRCMEIDPGKVDKQEGAEPAQHGMEGKPCPLPDPVCGEPGAVEGAPCDKRPACPVPYPAQKKGEEYVEKGPARASFVAAKGDVDVIAEPA